jgi:FAD:protein FMN transferase
MGAVEHERRFEVFGTTVRLLLGRGTDAEGLGPRVAAIQGEGVLRRIHRELTRFDPESRLSTLNDDPAHECGVSPLLAIAVESAVGAARRSYGLVDPTQLGALERAGYARSLLDVEAAPLRAALLAAPLRRPARPDPDERWRGIRVDLGSCSVSRPPGLRIDLGGTAKGLAADLLARRFESHESFVVDAGGDMRIGGRAARPRLVEVEHPLASGPAHAFELTSGAVATSGIGTRVWRDGHGFAHHLLDPATGQPAWTGVVQATALARTALEAETLAKAALLAGPDGAAEWLAEHGGVVIADDGEVALHGQLALAPVGALAVAAA